MGAWLRCVACSLALGSAAPAALARGPGTGDAHQRHDHGTDEPRSPQSRTGKRPPTLSPQQAAHRRAEARSREAAHDHSRNRAHPHQASTGPYHHGPEGHAHGARTEHIFGFTEGSDVHAAGETELKSNTIARFVKRAGRYLAAESKAEIHTGVTDDLNVAIGFLGDYHRVRSVPGFETVPARAAFGGGSVEMRWRLLRREEAGFGVTLLVEPSVSRFDELSGLRASRIGAETALLIDTELVRDTLYGAVNLLYDLERTRERGASATERGSTAGLGAALSYKLAPGLFVGGEARYLRAYEGLGLDRFQGEALFVGPTLFASLSQRVSLTAAYNVQVAGREALGRRGAGEATEGEEPALPGGPARRSSLDLTDFERHQVRLKLVYDF